MSAKMKRNSITKYKTRHFSSLRILIAKITKRHREIETDGIKRKGIMIKGNFHLYETIIYTNIKGDEKTK